MAVGPFFVSKERAEVGDITQALYIDRLVLITPRPKLTGDVAGFVKPFTPQVRAKQLDW